MHIRSSSLAGKLLIRRTLIIIGKSKPISDLAATVPGSHFVYAVVELAAFEPDYVSPSAFVPMTAPLGSAIDLFITERIKELAKQNQ